MTPCAYDVRHPARPRRLWSINPGLLGPGASVVAPGGRTAYVRGAVSTAVAMIDLRHHRVLARRGAPSAFDEEAGLALSPDGSRLVLLRAPGDSDQGACTSSTRRLHLPQKVTGPCLPQAVAVSVQGPTRGRFYVGDDGMCGRSARVTPYLPTGRTAAQTDHACQGGSAGPSSHWWNSGVRSWPDSLLHQAARLSRSWLVKRWLRGQRAASRQNTASPRRCRIVSHIRAGM